MSDSPKGQGKGSPGSRQSATRRKGREYAMQILYAMEIGHITYAEALSTTEAEPGLSEEARQYAFRLSEKTYAKAQDLDALIREAASHWDLERIAVVDRILIRSAAAEMLYFADVPVRVAISEAIDIAKKYSTGDSSRFVNGVLDAIARKIAPAETREQRKEEDAEGK